jgi:hypothetical protein
MTRCTYFSIECDRPSPGWTLSLSSAHIPFHMLGLTGVVLSPPGSTHEFSSTDDIRRLFDDVEEHELRIERVRTEVAWNDHEFAAFFDSMGFEPAARLVLEAEISEE